MKKDWSTIEILKHSRHDWLNRIQLIKGNIAMGKTERVNAIIDEIIIDAQNESNLTNLQIPAFSSMLMTYNWLPHSCQVEYEVVGDVRNLSGYDQVLTEWCAQFLAILEEASTDFGENLLMISIEIQEHETRFFFDFSGILKETTMLVKWVEEMKETKSPLTISEFAIHKNEAIVKILVN